ncbi:MAG: hypothetical protein JRE40_06570 [Deltaproteobacteria bacterium]|nr:hypothetical protein [Deltaproteobacteria bacterium]
MGLLNDISLIVARLPLEKLFYKQPNRIDQLDTLQEALSVKKQAIPKQQPEAMEQRRGGTPQRPMLSTAETVAYQNREIGKQLVALEFHYAQRMRIRGVPCDCGSSKHLLYLEQLCQETIPMVSEPSVYEGIISWIKEVEPKSTDAAASSGLYDAEYPVFAQQARDFRKSVMGTLSLAAMVEPKQEITLEEAKAEAARLAAEAVEARWAETQHAQT